jgi:deoxyribodipyrimidine photolyase
MFDEPLLRSHVFGSASVSFIQREKFDRAGEYIRLYVPKLTGVPAK